MSNLGVQFFALFQCGRLERGCALFLQRYSDERGTPTASAASEVRPLSMASRQRFTASRLITATMFGVFAPIRRDAPGCF